MLESHINWKLVTPLLHLPASNLFSLRRYDLGLRARVLQCLTRLYHFVVFKAIVNQNCYFHSMKIIHCVLLRNSGCLRPEMRVGAKTLRTATSTNSMPFSFVAGGDDEGCPKKSHSRFLLSRSARGQSRAVSLQLSYHCLA